MVKNTFKLPNEQHFGNFEKQTVFKQPGEVKPIKYSETSIGLNENIVGTLTYLFGFVSGFILLLVERENRYVCFHAIQSIFISIVFFTVYILLSMLPVIGWISGVILSPIGLVLWIILMLNAYNGKYSKFYYIGEFAEKQ